MREQNPLFLGNDLHEILLDLHRVGLPRQVEPRGDPLYVGTDRHARRAPMGRAEPDVGDLAGGFGGSVKSW